MKGRCLCGALTLLGLVALLQCPAGGQEAKISGVVSDGSKPLAGAIVRLQTTTVFTRTNERGEFTLDLSGMISAPLAKLTAYAPGFYIGGPFLLQQGQRNAVLTLKKHPETDDPAYEWLSPFSSAGEGIHCQNCHSNPAAKEPLLPFDEWILDAHGRSAQNRRFLSMYNGTDLSGERASPPTRYAVHKDYGRIPLPPDPNLPYFGPGFKLDFPESAGNCASCHLPIAAERAPYGTDPNAVGGVGKEGIVCDLCHKIWAVKLNPSTGLPYPNTPGVLAIEFRRPSSGHQLFIGPFDDVAPGEDTFSPLQNESRICAPCHFGQFWGVQVYNSFGEWLESPYSDPVKGQTCQNCHMPRRGATSFVRVDKGGLRRDSKTIFSHLMPGAADVALLRDTAQLEVEARQDGSVIRAKVAVTNAKAGHHMPTDHPARNILLVVTARDAGGVILPFLRGPVVPDWGGKGDEPTDYAGRPGRGYAKILEELWTEVSPTAAYWNPAVLREDTRIPAFGKDLSQYEFRALVGGGSVTVEARLIFRRAFKILVKQKKWDVADILMGQVAATVESEASGLSAFTSVPAATFASDRAAAPESIVSGFGDGLAAVTQVAGETSPPTVLAETSVIVRDSSGAERPAPLLFVSYGQINYIVPRGTAKGPAAVQVINLGRAVAVGRLNIEPVAPTLFTANGDGRGVAAAVAIRTEADGSQSHQAVFRCGAAPGSCVAVPIDLGAESDQVILSLSGTGIRGLSGLSAVSVRIGGLEVPVLSAGPQSQFAGLDQVNVGLPRSLAGCGEVDVVLTVDGKAANVVRVSIL